MINAAEARALAGRARPDRKRAEADTLAESALGWALRNAETRTDARVRTYATYGRSSLAVKFAPGEHDGKGNGNSFYSDLVANSNVEVADAVCAIVYGREQDLISSVMSKRLLNTFNARLVRFVRELRRLGYDVRTGTDAYGNANLDDSTMIVSWE